VLWCLTIFQLYRGGQFYWWRKPEYLEKTTDLPQVTADFVVLFNSIIVPLLKGHPFSNDKVASLEEDNLLVLYYAHVSI
jgi:hypothetical protein